MADLLVIVPALNEEAAIGGVVGAARRALAATVVVVDDGSTDATGEVAAAAGGVVVRHPFNLGVGAAVRTGLRYASENGYETVLQLDGDGQHDPRDAAGLLSRLEQGDVDVVVGSRFANGYDLSRSRRAVMRLLARLVSRRLGTEITDTTSGFRAFGGRSVGYFAQVYPAEYLSDTVEALLLAADAHLRVAEVAVHMRRRTTGSASASTVMSAFYVVRLLLVVLVHRFRPAPGRPDA
ncbi:MAG TPA: glycosyltransferase family 2 protein [Acidimicrobiales bacterium]|nr:glycosyltransferase family 2 protein [Acidimicrobiales bacterium]